MKAWMLVPVAAVALAVGLFTAPQTSNTSVATVAHIRVGTAVSVRVAVIAAPVVMTDACVFSAEAMAAGAPAQCGAPVIAPAVIRMSGGHGERALVWPGDFIELTASAAVEAWDATLCFVDSLFGYARETASLDI